MSRAPSHPTDDRATCDRLLEAAGQVFAESGYRDTTIRDICTRAGANVAAVNYHFGGKEGLYREVFRHAACTAAEQYPISFETDTDPESMLRQLCQMFIRRLLDPGRPAWHGKLIAREMVESSPILDEMVESWIRPQELTARRIVAANLGLDAEDPRVRRATISVMGQMLVQHHCRAVLDRLNPAGAYTAEANDDRAAFVAEFSIAALRALREKYTGKEIAR